MPRELAVQVFSYMDRDEDNFIRLQDFATLIQEHGDKN